MKCSKLLAAASVALLSTCAAVKSIDAAECTGCCYWGGKLALGHTQGFHKPSLETDKIPITAKDGYAKCFHKPSMNSEKNAREAHKAIMCARCPSVHADQITQPTEQAFIKAAEDGNTNNQFTLGAIYKKQAKADHNVHTKYSAYSWFKMAADAGHREAMFQLGLAYEGNTDGNAEPGAFVPQNHQLAVYWYQQSAEQGYAPAQNNLALYYEFEEEFKDRERALYWYGQAAAQDTNSETPAEVSEAIDCARENSAKLRAEIRPEEIRLAGSYDLPAGSCALDGSNVSALSLKHLRGEHDDSETSERDYLSGNKHQKRGGVLPRLR